MKITQLRQLVKEMIAEQLELESQASDDAKRQGLTYMRFGRWGKDGKVTHTTQSGKLVPLKSMSGLAGKKAAAGSSNAAGGGWLHHRYNRLRLRYSRPDLQRFRNLPEPAQDAKFDSHGVTGTDAGNRIVNKVNSKFYDTGDTLTRKHGYYKPISSDEFTSATGIPKKAAVWTAQNNNYEQPFNYDSETDTFSINDPMDV
jgi:hypothetical protein